MYSELQCAALFYVSHLLLFSPSTTDCKDKGSSVEHNQKAAGFTTIDLSVYRVSKLCRRTNKTSDPLRTVFSSIETKVTFFFLAVVCVTEVMSTAKIGSRTGVKKKEVSAWNKEG